MKKVLYADLYYPPSHRHMEEVTFSNLSKVCDLFIMAPKDWYTDLPNTAFIIETPNYHQSSVKSTKNRLCNAIKNIRAIRRNIDKWKIDVLVLGEFENYIIPIMLIMLPKRVRVLIMYHNNIDMMIHNNLQRFFFEISKYKFNHLVLDDFIADELVNTFRIKKEKVYCWPHPMYETLSKEKREFDCVGISQSNDEKTIRAIIETEKQRQLIKNNGLKVLLRSKETEYDNGNLLVMKGWLTNEQYQLLLDNAKCVLVPFSTNSFQYRPSGTIIDAFSRNASVLGSDIALIRNYSEKYPSICKVFHTETFVQDIQDMLNNYSNIEDFEKFKLLHSSSTIQGLMKQSLEEA